MGQGAEQGAEGPAVLRAAALVQSSTAAPHIDDEASQQNKTTRDVEEKRGATHIKTREFRPEKVKEEI